MKKSVEVESVVRRFLESRVANEMDAMHGLHSDSEFLRLIPTDEVWFQGQNAVFGSGGSVGDADLWVVKDSSILRIEAFEEGSVGWAAAVQERTFVSGKHVVLRMTMVLRLESSIWKVIQLRFSTAAPDDWILVEPSDLPQTLSDLLDSLDGDIPHEAIDGAGLATATVMFTDVVDSTTLSKELGDKQWSEAISGHFLSVKAIVEEQGGMQIKTLGDGGMYVFPSATSAVQGAIGVQRLVDSGDDRGKAPRAPRRSVPLVHPCTPWTTRRCGSGYSIVPLELRDWAPSLRHVVLTGRHNGTPSRIWAAVVHPTHDCSGPSQKISAFCSPQPGTLQCRTISTGHGRARLVTRPI